MKCYRLLVVIVFLGFFNQYSIAQDVELPGGVTEGQILMEIEKRGLEEEEVRDALTEAGFDMDDLNSITPEQLPEIQRIIDELVASKQEPKAVNIIVKKEKEPEVLKEVVVENESTNESNNETSNEIYGHRMFSNKEIKFFSNNDGIRAPEYYVLGTGDELSVSIFGNSYMEGNYVINTRGDIQIINGLKKVSLKGLSLSEARKKLKRIFSSHYAFKDGEFNLSLNYSRPVSVSVYGEVKSPGTITLPAINNVFNALSAVGGPNEIGSIRKIQVTKKDGSRVELDLFDYLNNPSSNKAFFLSDNDQIIVPAAELLVDVKGAINRPMVYELKKGEGLKTLIEFAGGFSKQAYTKSLKVSRVKENQKVFIDIDYTNNAHFALQNGDGVVVKEISSSLTNYVKINGEVVSGGQYERKKGMKVLDLVKKAGLKPETRLDLMFLRRVGDDNKITHTSINLDEILKDPTSDQNILLEDKDELKLWSKGLFLEKGSVTVYGSVRDSVSLEVNGNESMTVKEAILLAGGFDIDASTNGMIFRQKENLKSQIQYINLDFQNGPNSLDFSITLRSEDKLIIYSENVFQEESEIVISGAVNAPGVFQYGKNMTLKQALLLAGGTKISAAKNRIEISRTILKENEPTQTVIAELTIDEDYNVKSTSGDFELRPFDRIFVRDVPNFELQTMVRLDGEVKFPGNYAIISENETIVDVIKRAGGLTDEGFAEGASLYRAKENLGYLIIKLDEVIENDKSKFNFKLRGGDVIEIPKINDFVTIQGATKVRLTLDDKLIDEGNVIHVPFEKGKSLRYYVEEYAGGFDKKADKNKISVIYPNGGMKSSKNYIVYRTYPKVKTGSIINIGYKDVKPVEEEGDKEKVDWDRIVNNTISQATTMLTLLAVTKNLSK